MKKLIFLHAFLFITLFVKGQYYTGSNIQFGQNRVQYNTFFWQSYDFERFKVHFTQSGQKHAVYAAKSAHQYLHELEAFLDYHTEEKIHFIVYNTLGAFRQSNIGLTNDMTSNIGGTARIEGNKIFLYYEGDHEKFNRQIRAGLAELLVNRILNGDNWKQALKNASFLNIPLWFKQGLIDYLKGPWTTEIDNKVKDLVLNDKFNKLNRLEGDESFLAGHALWNYVDEVYGEKMIPNILYMTRVSKNIESGFIYVLGTTLSKISDDYVNYYKERYLTDEIGRINPDFEELKIKSRKKRVYQQFKISPDGKFAAFVTNKLGQYKVYTYEIDKQRLRRIGKGNHKLNRIPDYSHPNLAWHPTSKVLAFIEEKKGDLVLNLYDVKDRRKTKRKLLNIEKVLSIAYSPSGQRMVFSAVNKGKTDLYIYNVVGNSQQQITNDLYDDLSPQFVHGSRNIIFSSNRPDDTLRPMGKIMPIDHNFDIYIINLNKKKILTRITQTPLFDEKFPSAYDNKHYTYISNKNGIYNRYITYEDSAISHIDTSIHYRYFDIAEPLSNYSRDVLELNHNANEKQFSMLIKTDGSYHFYHGKNGKDYIIKDELRPTAFMKYLTNHSGKTPIPEIQTKDIFTEPDSIILDINNYIFENEKVKSKKDLFSINNKTDINETQSKIKDKIKPNFELPRQDIYKVNFTIDQLVMQLNPTFNNQSYQRFTGSGFHNAGFDGFTLVNSKDLFEDYRLFGGFRGPIQINNTGYLFVYEDLKSRVDKKYLISRQSYQQLNNNNGVEKINTYDLKYFLKYPFSEVSSLRLTNHLRYDHKVTLSTEPTTLNKENENYYLGGALLEFVYDITRPIALNIQNGTKFKIWGEFYHELNVPETDFFVLGFDFRNYQKIHRNIVFATRLAANTSFGSQKLLYYMGGVDNWMWAKFDPSIIPDPEQNYQFQTIATPVRGFFQNARNGNSFIVINNELRIPLISYLSPKPLKSDFLENFMIIGFSDVGTAWTGKSPYSSANSFNTTIINGHNYTITLQNQKQPIIYGYGFGLRSRLLGYYIRFDLAWGVNDGIIMPSVKHLSLSLDF